MTYVELTETERRFLEFHGQNPHVLPELVRLARIAVQSAAFQRSEKKKIGIRMLWEVMRWNFTIEVDRGGDKFKFNDHLTSRYSRMIMKRCPDLDGVFEIRELRS